MFWFLHLLLRRFRSKFDFFESESIKKIFYRLVNKLTNFVISFLPLFIGTSKLPISTVPFRATLPAKVAGERDGGVEPIAFGAVSEMAKIAREEVEEEAFPFAKLAGDCDQCDLK